MRIASGLASAGGAGGASANVRSFVPVGTWLPCAFRQRFRLKFECVLPSLERPAERWRDQLHRLHGLRRLRRHALRSLRGQGAHRIGGLQPLRVGPLHTAFVSFQSVGWLDYEYAIGGFCMLRPYWSSGRASTRKCVPVGSRRMVDGRAGVADGGDSDAEAMAGSHAP